MFSDLRGFTSFSENATEVEIFDVLHGYFELVVTSVEQMGGDVLKFMSDGILSIFAIASSTERDQKCRQAALAAKGVLTGLASLNQDRRLAGKQPLELGIGINAGHVSNGNIGSPGRLDFTVLGGR